MSDANQVIINSTFALALKSLDKRVERLEGVVESVVEELGKREWKKDNEGDEWKNSGLVSA